MKPPWIILLALLLACSLGAGAMWWNETTQATALQSEVAQLKTENVKLNRDLGEASEKVAALESESAQLRAARVLSASRLEPAAAPAGEPARAKNQGGFLARMLRDPAMRKMMAAQQAGALRGYYSDFIRQARLTPDQADKFFQLLEERQMALMDSSASLMSGSGVDASAITAATNTANTALKDLLGPQIYGQYQDFEKTLGDRVQVQQFNQQLGAAGVPLQDYQSQALIQIMSQEQANLPNFQSGAGAQQAMTMSPAQLDQYSQQVDAMNQRVYNRAMAVLSPPQLSAFATFQKNMATAQVAGLKITQQLLKGNE